MVELGFRFLSLSPQRCFSASASGACLGGGHPAAVYSTISGERLAARRLLHARFGRNGADTTVMTNSFGALGDSEPVSGKSNLIVVAGELAMGLGIQSENHWASKLQEHLSDQVVFNVSIPQADGVALIDRARGLLTDLKPKVLVFCFQIDSWRPEPAIPIYETSLGLIDAAWSLRWSFEWLLRRYYTIRNYQGSYLTRANKLLLEAHADISANWWSKENAVIRNQGRESYLEAPGGLEPNDINHIIGNIDRWGSAYALISWEGTGKGSADGRFVFPELRKLAQDALPLGTEILITILPGMFQLQNSSNLPQEYFRTFAETEPGIRYFDTLNAFRSSLRESLSSSQGVLHAIDRLMSEGTHMTSRGHGTIASALKEVLGEPKS